VSLITVIIPTLNAEAHLVRTLSSLVPGVVQGLIKDVIIVDGGSEDSTLEIAESTGCQIIAANCEQGLQLWQGCKAARGDWLMILHSDSDLSPNWMDEVRAHIKDYALRAGYFQLRFEQATGQARFWEYLVKLRATWLALPSGDHGLFMSRALYESAGGYKDQIAFEEISLTMTLGRTRLRPMGTASITTNLKRFQAQGWVANLVKKALSFILYLLGFPPKPPSKRHLTQET
jgi:hypothetical protein